MNNNTIAKYLSDTVYSNIVKKRVIPLEYLKDTYITGGALYSLKVKPKDVNPDEFVNDYDIYFTNKQSLLSAVKHILTTLYSELLEPYMNGYGKNRKLDETQFDDFYHEIIKFKLIFKDSADNRYDETAYYMDENNKIYVSFEVPSIIYELLRKDRDDKYEKFDKFGDTGITYVSTQALTFGKYQFITRFCGPPDIVHQYFDFEHAKGYFMPREGTAIFSHETLKAIYEKRLVYSGSKYPIASIFRMNKFTKRGFVIDKIDILKMIFQIYKLDLTNKEILLDQLSGFYGDDPIPDILKFQEPILDSDIFDEIIKALEKAIKSEKYPYDFDSHKNIDASKRSTDNDFFNEIFNY